SLLQLSKTRSYCSKLSNQPYNKKDQTSIGKRTTPVDYGRSAGETKAKRDYGSKITALSVAVYKNQLGKLKERNEEKESLEMESEKRILVTSQMEEVPESLRYPKLEESTSKDCGTQGLEEKTVEKDLEV